MTFYTFLRGINVKSDTPSLHPLSAGYDKQAPSTPAKCGIQWTNAPALSAETAAQAG